MKQEYGNYGINLLNEYLTKGSEMTQKYGDYTLNGYYIPDDVAEAIEPESNYLVSSFVLHPVDTPAVVHKWTLLKLFDVTLSFKLSFNLIFFICRKYWGVAKR